MLPVENSDVLWKACEGDGVASGAGSSGRLNLPKMKAPLLDLMQLPGSFDGFIGKSGRSLARISSVGQHRKTRIGIIILNEPCFLDVMRRDKF